jgi:hypothetical protein
MGSLLIPLLNADMTVGLMVSQRVDRSGERAKVGREWQQVVSLFPVVTLTRSASLPQVLFLCLNGM